MERRISPPFFDTSTLSNEEQSVEQGTDLPKRRPCHPVTQPFGSWVPLTRASAQCRSCSKVIFPLWKRAGIMPHRYCLHKPGMLLGRPTRELHSESIMWCLKKRLCSGLRSGGWAGRDACPTKAAPTMALVAQASVPAIVAFAPSAKGSWRHHARNGHT